ncbi:polysaccharide deacetylase family protein [Candidatus Halocynthiibacter alkanivorans]|uniref:polysaccharide deacetylase family protein n=1 Tax=Candidatus Halocynthiibacter alkanivorans TaxID=2267619 RepID=UPI000DF1962D|nr:polysaccharide deacetylase family protein [Candidatus Halocynthiibacter alkanivorans]
MTAESLHHIILNFHGLGTPHADVDATEAPYWLSVAQFEQVLDRVQSFSSGGGRVRLTFDDGNRSDLEIAVQKLRQRGLEATFFVLLGRMADPRYLSAEDIRDMAASDMNIGLHGRHHLDWRHVAAETFQDETVRAAYELSEITGSCIDEVAIPFGAYNRKIMAALHRQHFRKIHTSDTGAACISARIQPRNTIRADTDVASLGQILQDRYSLQRRLKRRLSQLLRRHLL